MYPAHCTFYSFSRHTFEGVCRRVTYVTSGLRSHTSHASPRGGPQCCLVAFAAVGTPLTAAQLAITQFAHFMVFPICLSTLFVACETRRHVLHERLRERLEGILFRKLIAWRVVEDYRHDDRAMIAGRARAARSDVADRIW